MYGYEVFHEELLSSLIDAVRGGHVQHAYIFEGGRGIGKKKAARLFAAALACENGGLAPCGTCSACIGAKAETNPDIRDIDSGDKKSIGVELMREIASDAYLKPFESKKKIYMIDGDLITEQAQNSFLKVLEEPPEYAVFIILVANAEALLQTIKSRCTLLRFTPLSKEKIMEYIKKTYPDADAEFLANYSEGNPGRADDIMKKDNFFILRQSACDMLVNLLSNYKISAYRAAEYLEENKEESSQILEFWQGMLRDIIFIQNGAQGLVINSDIKERLKELAGRFSTERCLHAQDCLQKAAEMQRRYVNLRAMALNLALSIKGFEK